MVFQTVNLEADLSQRASHGHEIADLDDHVDCLGEQPAPAFQPVLEGGFDETGTFVSILFSGLQAMSEVRPPFPREPPTPWR
jgi:hypothetical protein